MAEGATEARDLPARGADGQKDSKAIWIRGAWMLVFALLFEVGKSVMAVGAVFQFVWMLIKGEKNRPIAGFGADLANWLAQVARFLSGASDDKPFPFAPWKQGQP